MNRIFKRAAAAVVASVMLFVSSVIVSADNSTAVSPAQVSVQAEEVISYADYLESYADAAAGNGEVYADIKGFMLSKGGAELKDDIYGVYALETDEMSTVTFGVDIPSDGMYSIELNYCPIEGKGSSIVRNVYIDGALPYAEAKNISLTRYVVNEKDEIETDSSGNELRPTQTESPRWIKTSLYESLGYYDDPLAFHLTDGAHTITLEAVREPLAICQIRLYGVQKAVSYEQYISDRRSADAENVYIKIQGEAATAKSDTMLYPDSNNSSSSIEPSSYKNTVINVIGGSKWSTCGQWIEWETDIKQSGYYKIAIKVKQNTEAGQPSYRKLTIDGQLPFAELGSVKFPYDTRWQNVTVGGEEAQLIYLEKGKHTLRLECVLGELSELVRGIDASIESLNGVYRSFLMVIGQNSDTERDYDFEERVPGAFKILKEQSKILFDLYDRYMEISGVGGSQAETIRTMAKQVEMMYKDPDCIASQFSDFSTNISSLGTWLTTALTQSLTIDYIVIASPEKEIEKAENGFFKNLAFSFLQFIASFSVDYSSVGVSDADTESSITVWIGTGRDQANVLQRLITNDFTAKSGIGVNMQLVAAGTVLMATLAGKGPDVTLSLNQTDLMNYAFRGAVYDISEFDDYKEVTKRFQPSAVSPLVFNNASYGLPETQSFYMMFYRTDILNDLNLSVPQTWSQVMAMLPVLQKNNMNFGMPAAVSTAATGVGMPVFTMLYYQLSGSYYNEDGSRCLLDSNEALDAFDMWTKFYTDYGFSLDYNFLTQFRSGTVPIGIADYGTYNSLSVFAPELNGVWKFTVVPGTEDESGNINRTVSGTITACAIMNDVSDPESSWEFMKWWTSSSIQTAYGRELESIMGSAARYQTANKEAFYQLPWSNDDFTILMEQWNQTEATPEVPGSYMTVRYLDFAFKNVVMSGAADPARVLMGQNVQINAEIKTKREEFGLQ